MPETPTRGARFTYVSYDLDETGWVSAHYDLDGRRFCERTRIEVPAHHHGAAAPAQAMAAAARLFFLLAAVSYYKTGAPPVIDLGSHTLTSAEAELLKRYYIDGLGEFAHENNIDLSDLSFQYNHREPSPTLARHKQAAENADQPLIPFGGGIDSVVVVEQARARGAQPSLFIANRENDRYAAIEAPAAVTGLPIVRAERALDPQVLRSAELGFLNGHVPVTGVISAIAVLAAVASGHSSVVMSNEWSASSPTLVSQAAGGREVNHQWSKSMEFETLFRAVLGQTITGIDYYSALRPYSELWVADRFAKAPQYHRAFRSCNKAFYTDPAKRYTDWCGVCDKCCFIDLILSPYVPAQDLAQIFAGAEPLANPGLLDRFRSLIGDPALFKPFECVGDVGECRTAVMLAAVRPDRRANATLQTLADYVTDSGVPVASEEHLLEQLSAHYIPEGSA